MSRDLPRASSASARRHSPAGRAADPHTVPAQGGKEGPGDSCGRGCWPASEASLQSASTSQAAARAHGTFRAAAASDRSQEPRPPGRSPRASTLAPPPPASMRTKPICKGAPPAAAAARAAAWRPGKAAAEARPSALGGARPPKSVLPVGRQAAQGRGQPDKQEAAA